MQIVYFLILIGVLVFIHEFGHFFFARVFGVKVERFAIGMGPVIGPLSFKRGDTDYTICALPIGGYVKMFGMQPEELYDEWGAPLSEEECSRAFVRKPIWQRAVIVAAGPAINLIFPVFVYFFLGMGMGTMPPPIVGQVTPDSPASAARAIDGKSPNGLMAGDKITAIDGEPVKYWEDLTDIVEDSAGIERTFTVMRGDIELRFAITPQEYTHTDRLGLSTNTKGIIGVTSEVYGPVIALQGAGSPAEKAGLRAFDRIVSVGGVQTKSFIAIQAAVRASGGKPLKIVAMRGAPVDFLGGGMATESAIETELTPVKDSQGLWSAGIQAADMIVAAVEPDSPAHKAGLLIGDEILTIGGKRYNKMRLVKYDIQQRFWEQMNADPDTDKTDIRIPFEVNIKRGDQDMTLSYAPVIREFQGPLKEMVPQIWFGFDTRHAYDLPEPIAVPFLERIPYSAKRGVVTTWEFSVMMVKGIGQMVTGRMSTDSLGGPIMIFDIAGKAGSRGLEEFLWMMALISINLGLINLLPIPVLDGGHLMLFAIEAIKRKELNARTRQIAYYIGFSLIVLLMLVALKNDIERYWQDFVMWLNV